MPIHIRILKSTRLSQTAGAAASSPAKLISGTAVPTLGFDVNTTALFSRDVVTVGRLLDPTKGVVTVNKSKKGVRKHGKSVVQSRRKFEMMPAYSGVQQGLEMRPANTPLRAKAQEDMSDFEREYPW